MHFRKAYRAERDDRHKDGVGERPALDDHITGSTDYDNGENRRRD